MPAFFVYLRHLPASRFMPPSAAKCAPPRRRGLPVLGLALLAGVANQPPRSVTVPAFLRVHAKRKKAAQRKRWTASCKTPQ
jgi:hypothetical protein